MKHKNFDFGGYATKNDLRCTDGRTIRKDAFSDDDGAVRPLVWNHQHNEATNVLGHALLENREDGVYAYCTFNNTPEAQHAKELIRHGDIDSLSIWANQLKQKGSDVLHGTIREVSLVYAGANPGAFIDAIMCHGEESEEEAIIYTGEGLSLSHSDGENDDGDDAKKEDKKMPEGTEKKTETEKTVQDVIDTMTDEQKNVMYAIIGNVLEHSEDEGDEEDDEDDDIDDEDEGGKGTMKHNAFDTETQQKGNYLSHSDQEAVLALAKTGSVGSFQEALGIYADENGLQHDALSSGFAQTGDGNVTTLFPEYKDVRPGAPELITNDQGWIDHAIAKVHKSPISRIRTRQVDIRNIESLRAKGYVKGKQKGIAGNFKLVRRTTDPQTVFVKSAIHRDDIIDITDFDYVQYLYNIDKMMLKEELATAIMLGDGRDEGADDKISSEHIRPIWLDDELYTIHVDVDLASAKTELQGTNTSVNFGENYVYAEAILAKLLYAREQYRGSGTPDFYLDQHVLNVMLLAKDINGRRIYNNKADLATALNVNDIFTAEQFANKTRTTSDNKVKKLLGIVVNLADYSLGATKGGEITHFTQFDIDFNQEKSLIETRTSGALTRVCSAIALEEDVTPTTPADTDDDDANAEG